MYLAPRHARTPIGQAFDNLRRNVKPPPRNALARTIVNDHDARQIALPQRLLQICQLRIMRGEHKRMVQHLKPLAQRAQFAKVHHESIGVNRMGRELKNK
jgi:hypothetical protein